MFVDAVQLTDDDVVQQDVEQQGDDDVDNGIVGSQREQGRQCTWTCNQREGDGDDAGTAFASLVLDDFASENHLHGEDEQHECACHGKRFLVDAEEFQQGVTGKEESQKQGQGRQTGLSRLDGLVLSLHAHEDGDGAEDVNDGSHDDKGAKDFYKVDLREHGFLFLTRDSGLRDTRPTPSCVTRPEVTCILDDIIP